MLFDYAGYIQIDVRAGDIDHNLARIKTGLAGLAEGHRRDAVGLVALPELWATGFAYSRLPDLVRRIPAVLATLRELAAEYNVCLAGSLPEAEQGDKHIRYHNTMYLVGPPGIIGTYRKQHLFPPMQEDTFFSPGEDPGPVKTPWGAVACLVCYDLRFPELVRCQAARGATILVVAAQWPMARIEHWQTLIRARAIENQLYVIAANRCGTTGDTRFAGHSMMVAPDGTVSSEAGPNEESSRVALAPELINEVRGRFNTLPPQ